MVSALLSRCLMLVLGTLYPAYRSYKAIKNKDVREHVKWMMYWIVFALFTTLETFLDIFFSWFPFYYEIKILFILWVLSPATRGSSMLYKKIVHPMLNSREKDIDDLIEKTKHQGYTTFLSLFQTGFSYASDLFLNSALKGQLLLGTQLKKSLSMNDDMNFLATNGNANANQSSSSSSSSTNTSNQNSNNNNDLYNNEEDMGMGDLDGGGEQHERIRRMNNNKNIYDQQVQQVYRQQQQEAAQKQKEQRKPRKGSMAQLNGAATTSSTKQNIYSTINSNYGMEEQQQDGGDDNLNVDTEQLIPAKKKTTTRRASSRKLLQQQPDALDSYGSLTRRPAKASTSRLRNKLNSVPTLLNSQQQQQQPIVVHDSDL